MGWFGFDSYDTSSCHVYLCGCILQLDFVVLSLNDSWLCDILHELVNSEMWRGKIRVVGFLAVKNEFEEWWETCGIPISAFRFEDRAFIRHPCTVQLCFTFCSFHSCRPLRLPKDKHSFSISVSLQCILHLTY